MLRSRNSLPSRLNRDAERLVALSEALDASGSRVEDHYWEAQMGTLLGKLLQQGQDATVDLALDALFQNNPGAYDILAEQAETLSESMTLDKNGETFDVLLIAAPVVAWTRYAIPSGRIGSARLDALRAHLHGHVLAADARLALAPMLYSLDQMPRTFSTTRGWLTRLAGQAMGRPAPRPGAVEEAADMLADARYLVGAVVVPRGAAMFRWQEHPGEADHSREACLRDWAAQAGPLFGELLPGCGYECLVPDAYYVSNREADRRVRPLALRAAIGWMEGALGIEPAQLRAVVGGCGERDLEEYRIGFTLRNSNDVIYGCVWPLLGREDDTPENPLIEQIASLLREFGVADIRRLPGLLPPDLCDDCDAPYFPNPLGDMVHAEPPEDAGDTPSHFH